MSKENNNINEIYTLILTKDQKKYIQEFLQEEKYSSQSEFIRIAIINYINEIMVFSKPISKTNQILFSDKTSVTLKVKSEASKQ